jgi:hypothetical protein
METNDTHWSVARRVLYRLYNSQSIEQGDLDALRVYFNVELRLVKWGVDDRERLFGEFISDLYAGWFPKHRAEHWDEATLWEKFDNYCCNWLHQRRRHAITEVMEELNIAEPEQEPFALYHPRRTEHEEELEVEELRRQVRGRTVAETYYAALPVLPGEPWDWLRSEATDERWRDLYALVGAGIFPEVLALLQGLHVPAIKNIKLVTLQRYIERHPKLKSTEVFAQCGEKLGFTRQQCQLAVRKLKQKPKPSTPAEYKMDEQALESEVRRVNHSAEFIQRREYANRLKKR